MKPKLSFAPHGMDASHGSTRMKILQAAFEVISSQDLHDAKIDAKISEIAQKAGVVDSIIYYYFDNKEDLFFSVLDQLLKNTHEELKFHFQGIMGPVSRLGKLVWFHLYMNDTDQNTQIRKRLLVEARGKPSFLKHTAYQTLVKHTNLLDEILSEGVRGGYFRKDLNICLVRSVIFGFLDEECLMYTGAKGQGMTILDFDEIMALIMAMIEKSHGGGDSAGPSKKFFTILESAKKLFAENGFGSTTMLQVAADAGVSEGTIYQYFTGKHDLLLSITREYFSLYKTKLDRAFEFNSSLDRLRHVFWSHLRIFSADKDLVKVFLQDTKLTNHFFTTDAHNVFLSYHDPFLEVIEEGKAKGDFRKSLDLRIARNLITGGMSNAYNRWYFREPMSPLDTSVELHEFVELICRAVSRPE